MVVAFHLGLYEVSRELEHPYVNVPNNLPLTTIQAQFNEALVTMYAGYHPDSWWIVDCVVPSQPSLQKK
jgi:predicted membrane chloride channel (bestrophin family)